jgi:hypothetical protein
MAASSAAHAAAQSRQRDLRLDLARGLTMLIIFVAHVPANPWAEFIPARMGFSSGAEAFVLCSGLASGVAFGGVFRRQGWQAGSARIGRRIGQLWLIQIAAFAAFAALMLAVDAAFGGDLYQSRYSLQDMVARPLETMLAIAVLGRIPLFFDILPLYIVLLAATPLLMALAGWSHRLVLAMSAALWLAVQLSSLGGPAQAALDVGWYFNPLAWQFLFFIGYGVTSGWFTVPPPTRANLGIASGIVLGSFLLTFWGVHAVWPVLHDVYVAIYPDHALTMLHPLRLAHVLALGWLFAMLLRDHGDALARPAMKPLIAVGQQALPTFIAGIFLSALGGVTLDQAGRAPSLVAAVNVAGMLALVFVAYAARRAKSAPARIAARPNAVQHTPVQPGPLQSPSFSTANPKESMPCLDRI